jgi:outer membrane protein OmpA-like peptidoglycan-associated protein
MRLRLMRSLIYILLFIGSTASAQNLLVNPGFEEENICIEYQVNCAPEGWIYTVPSFIYYFKDRNLANKGSHFIALIAGHSKRNFYRTFVRSRLICGLKKGHTYRLELFVKSLHPLLDSVGVYFSSYDFLFEKRPYRSIEPSFYLADANIKPAIDTNWQKVVIDYKATGTETFISFGYFKKNDLTGATGIDRENNFYFLMDDVSFTPLNKDEVLCSDRDKIINEIYMQDERHEYLDRLIKYKRQQPLEVVKNSPTIIKKVDTLIIPDILFGSGDARLNKTSFLFLDSIDRIIYDKMVDSVVIEGHTDNTGDLNVNQVLGKARAETVAGYLKKKHPDATFISRGWGSERPATSNNTPEGRQTNRRVEIYLYIAE